MYKKFACRTLLVITLIRLSQLLLFFIIGMSFKDTRLYFALFFLVCCVVIIPFVLVDTLPGCRLVSVNSRGIFTKRVGLCWEEIGGAKSVTIEANIYTYSSFIYKDIDLACFSLEPEEGDYFSINRKRVVMIQMDKKTYQALNMYARGKSETVDRFLDSVDWYKCWD